jgi:hypothetical protein
MATLHPLALLVSFKISVILTILKVLAADSDVDVDVETVEDAEVVEVVDADVVETKRLNGLPLPSSDV